MTPGEPESEEQGSAEAGFIPLVTGLFAEIGQLVEKRLRLLGLEVEERIKAAAGLGFLLLGMATALFFAWASVEVFLAYVIYRASGSAGLTFIVLLVVNLVIAMIFYDAFKRRRSASRD